MLSNKAQSKKYYVGVVPYRIAQRGDVFSLLRLELQVRIEICDNVGVFPTHRVENKNECCCVLLLRTCIHFWTFSGNNGGRLCQRGRGAVEYVLRVVYNREVPMITFNLNQLRQLGMLSQEHTLRVWV